jgi:hypothetical protein
MTPVTLEQYRQMRGLSYLALAGELNAATGRRFSRGTVRNYCVGGQSATHETIRLVWLATNGAVEPNDWFDLDPKHLAAPAPQPQQIGEAA